MDERIRYYGKYNFKKNKMLYLMMLPFFAFFFTFTILPILYSIYISFTVYDVLNPPRWVGLENYMRLFLEDNLFVLSIQNTITIAIFIGPVGYILAFMVAWLINELPRRIRAVLTVIFFAPSLSGNAFVLFLFLFSNDPQGWLNSWLMSMGINHQAVLWLSTPATMRPILIGVSLWASLGFGFLSFVAGLQVVDKAQYEAAYVDGITNRWQELWFITLPNMRPQLMFGAVLSITGALSVGAMADMLFGFPSPYFATHTMINHLVDYGNVRMEMGYASAIAVLLLLLMLGMNQLIQKFLRRVGT